MVHNNEADIVLNESEFKAKGNCVELSSKYYSITNQVLQIYPPHNSAAIDKEVL